VTDELSAELKAFVFACIDSVEQMEILALLRTRATPLSANAVAQAIGIAPALTRTHLDTLTARGLLRTDVSSELLYRFAPATENLADYATRLIAIYSDSKTVVLRAIAQNARPSLKRFSDAFKLRGKE
jgi:DNA-binding IclR family transcriptional regulator